MGAQQTKDRVIPTGSTVRQTRKQPRNPKESRLIGSNIFTEHSGELLVKKNDSRLSKPLSHTTPPFSFTRYLSFFLLAYHFLSNRYFYRSLIRPQFLLFLFFLSPHTSANHFITSVIHIRYLFYSLMLFYSSVFLNTHQSVTNHGILLTQTFGHVTMPLFTHIIRGQSFVQRQRRR